LQQKHVVPPFIPPVKVHKTKETFVDFETIMNDLGKSSWLKDKPREEEDKYFSAW
jgi:hypothetical protein